MKKEIKLFDFKDKLPLTFSLIQFDSLFQHMHSYAELVIVLDGEFDCKIGEESFHCKEDDIFIVNPKTFHSSVSEQGATLLSLFIDQKGFGLNDDEIASHIFNLNTMKYGQSEKASEIRYLVYSIIKYNTMDNVNSIYTNRAIAYSMFAQLVNKFSIDVSQADKRVVTNDAYNDIAAYINDHYMEKLSLSSLAEHFQYSTAYLSRLFKQNFHVTFMDYYTSVRVNYSVDDLVSTNKTIEEIALSHGFDDPRSYVRAFKSVYNDEYPSEYRRKHRNQKQLLDVASLSKKYLNLILAKYENYILNLNRKSKEKTYREEEIQVDMKTSAEEISPLGNYILDVGSSRVLVYSELRDLISGLQNLAGFEYLALRDLFNQTVRLFIEDGNGNYFFSESILENLLGFCKRNYFKPYFKLEYDFISQPDSFYLAISSLIEYIKNHYDENEYKDWMFSITYTGKLSQRDFKSVQDFYAMVLKCAKRIKKGLPNVILVTPSFAKSDIIDFRFLEQFNRFCEGNDMYFDALSIRYIEENKFDYLQKDKNECLHFYDYLKEHFLIRAKKLFFESFNFTNRVNLLNDTVFSSSYFAKNLIDNVSNLSSLSKDAFFDSYGYEIQKNPFVGKSGMITYNGIKKASYNIFAFCNKLGTKLIKKGKNFIVTIKANKIVILLNNYVHYAQDYTGDDKELIEKGRYSCFPEARDRLFHFKFVNLEGDFIRIKKSHISKKSGSVYDLSLNVGDFGNMKREEIEEIRGLNYVFFSVDKEPIQYQRVNLDFSIEPLEVQLIEIEILKNSY